MTVAVDTRIEVGTLRSASELPSPSPLGFRLIDPEWCWVVREEEEAVCALLAAPCHGMVFLVRLWAKEGCGMHLPALLRTVLRDCSERGFLGYFSYFDLESETEKKIARIAGKAGSVMLDKPFHLIGGSIANARRW